MVIIETSRERQRSSLTNIIFLDYLPKFQPRYSVKSQTRSLGFLTKDSQADQERL